MIRYDSTAFPGPREAYLVAPMDSVPSAFGSGVPSVIEETQQRQDQAYALSLLLGRINSYIPPHSRTYFATSSCPAELPRVDDLQFRLEETLRSVFGLTAFHSGQLKTIQAIMQGQDTLTILPTGSGKSLCFQLPSVLLSGLTVVVSPLIALMEDQVCRLPSQVKADRVHSGMSRAEQASTYERVRRREIKLLYVSPEQLGTKRFFDHVGERKVSLLVVDEAHCASTWGHDFRPGYLMIKEASERLGNPPRALLTATATAQTRADIKNVIGLGKCVENIAPASRENICLSVEDFSDESTKNQRLLELVSEGVDGATIVYCTTTISVDAISRFFESNRIPHRRYHAQLDPQEKEATHKAFVEGTINLIVCTKAFGMGIDRADVRRVVHFEVPGSLEDYYQEVGRAGRDRKPSEAILFFYEGDIRIQTHFIFGNNPTASFVRFIYRRLFEFYTLLKNRQTSTPTPAQLLRKIELDFKEKGPLFQMAKSAYAFFIESGYIVIEANEASFPLGEKIVINDKVVDDKRTRAYRTLGMMIQFARTKGEGHPGRFLQEYFDQWTPESWSRHPSLEQRIRKFVLLSLLTYEGTLKQHAMLLSGSGHCSAEARQHKLFGTLSVLTETDLEFMISALRAEELINFEPLRRGERIPRVVLTQTGVERARRMGITDDEIAAAKSVPSPEEPPKKAEPKRRRS